MAHELITNTGLRFLAEDELWAVLPVEHVVDALARRLEATSADELAATPRTVIPIPGRPAGDEAEMLLMPAHGPEGGGVKLVSIVRGNRARGLPTIQGVYLLLSPDGMTPELAIDGAALTGLRTASMSALATKHLALPDSGRLVVFGAGTQAACHVEAMRAILPIERVTIVGSSSTSRRAAALVERLVADGVDAVLGDAGAVADADVVCTCTTSVRPLFDDAALRPGVHINGIGAYRRDMCELPAASLARALLVVESVAATLIEAGDVVGAIEAGALPATGFAHELRDLLTGVVGRDDDEQITVFKSVGMAVEDLIVARAAADALAR